MKQTIHLFVICGIPQFILEMEVYTPVALKPGLILNLPGYQFRVNRVGLDGIGYDTIHIHPEHFERTVAELKQKGWKQVSSREKGL